MPSAASSTTSIQSIQSTPHQSGTQQQQAAQLPTQAPAQSAGKKPKKERAFKLTLLSFTDHEVECSFDTYKNYRITFKFDINEDESEDIAKSMVSGVQETTSTASMAI